MAETQLDGLTGVGLSEAEYTIIEAPQSGITFVGKARNQSTSTSAPEWQISRTIVSGNTSTTQFAIQGAYRAIWDDRTTYFESGSDGAFDNQFSIFFDGINDYLNYGNLSALSFENTQTFSFSLWMKHNSASNSAIFAKTNGNLDPGYYLQFANNQNLDFRINGTGGTLSVRLNNVRSETANTWTHIAVTYDGSQLASGVRMYINGANRSPNTILDTLSGTSINTRNFAIASNSNLNNQIQANIDELAAYSTNLSAGDVLEIFNFGRPADLSNLSTSSDLVFWTRMGDGQNDSFPTIFDEIGGAAGTMVNMMEENIENDVPGS